MDHKLTHFAIHIDDMDRAQKFYEKVFNWGINPFGPPGFMQIKSDRSETGELIGALQSRKYSILKENIKGLECTIGVENVDATINAVKNQGGTILMPKTTIPYVGWITKFLDTEGNLVCAMQYDQAAQ